MVELFCGILAGATWGPHIRSWQVPDETKVADLGQFFMALDPGVFGAGFEDRLQQLMDHHRALEPVCNFLVDQIWSIQIRSAINFTFLRSVPTVNHVTLIVTEYTPSYYNVYSKLL